MTATLTGAPGAPGTGDVSPEAAGPQAGGRWSRARRSPSTLAGGTLVALFAVVALVSLAWTPYDPLAIDPRIALHGSSAAHLLGTDQYGRDVLSRLMAGTQVAFYVGVIAVAIAAGIGVPAGLLAAQRGGVLGEVVMRIGDVVYGFPALLAAITLTAALGASTTVAMIAIGVAYIPVFARVSRASALTVLSSGYVLAARSYGRRPLAITRRHVLPNVAPILIVQASLLYAVAILAEAGLEFLGLGSPPPAPTWGAMIHDAQDYLARDPMFTVWPALVITLAVLGFSLLGDGLREVLDPGLGR
ncbi:MAG TPA: ABC transporter permease [Trebonia sp.]|nr:ABC transporter permease [Trebonia sp.]